MRIILLFLLSFSAFAGPACIFSGGNIKCLKDIIGFKSEKSIESGTIDPTSVATPGDTGSLFMRDTGVVYVKKDDGTTTNWANLSEVGSPFPAMAKGSIVTSNGTSNGEFTACANGERLEWDSTETSGVKCVSDPMVPYQYIEAAASASIDQSFPTTDYVFDTIASSPYRAGFVEVGLVSASSTKGEIEVVGFHGSESNGIVNIDIKLFKNTTKIATQTIHMEGRTSSGGIYVLSSPCSVIKFIDDLGSDGSHVYEIRFQYTSTGSTHTLDIDCRLYAKQ